MNKIKILSATISILISADLFGGTGDVYLKQRITQPDAKNEAEAEKIQETWVTETKVRSNTGNQSSILDLDRGLMITIDHAKKKYMEIPLNFSESLSQEDQQAADELPAFMKNMMKMEVSVQPTPETKQISRWQCTKYLQTTKMAMVSSESEIWASTDVHLNMEVYRKFSAALTASQPGFYKMFKDMLKETEKIKGVPVYQKSVSKAMGKTIETFTELLEVIEANAPADLFVVPAGYKQEKFKEK